MTNKKVYVYIHTAVVFLYTYKQNNKTANSNMVQYCITNSRYDQLEPAKIFEFCQVRWFFGGMERNIR